MADALLDVRGLNVDLISGRSARAVLSDVSFSIEPASIVGLFGESGSGKTTLALALLNLLPARHYRVRGSILLDGREIVGLRETAMQPIRGRSVSIVFQDPSLALNPVLTVRRQIGEVARAHGVSADIPSLLQLAGLTPSERVLTAYPHQLSGGERQRVLIAQALACRPALVIADEPFTALDAPRAVELAALFRRLQDATGAAFLVISHSPGVLARIAGSVLVMEEGRIVEQGPPREIFRSPAHPYTAALLAAAGGLPGRV